jgi:hypothetical protein
VIDVKSIATRFRINTDKFDAYARETAQLNIDTYSWYEEAQEAKNKDFKFVREHHTRKISRISTNENLLHYLLLSSDPIVSHHSRQRLFHYY